jgi:hypothetical protein
MFAQPTDFNSSVMMCDAELGELAELGGIVVLGKHIPPEAALNYALVAIALSAYVWMMVGSIYRTIAQNDLWDVFVKLGEAVWTGKKVDGQAVWTGKKVDGQAIWQYFKPQLAAVRWAGSWHADFSPNVPQYTFELLERLEYNPDGTVFEPAHFFIQALRLPRGECSPRRVCQIAFNIGQLRGCGGIEKLAAAHPHNDWQGIYDSLRLGKFSTYCVAGRLYDEPLSARVRTCTGRLQACAHVDV